MGCSTSATVTRNNGASIEGWIRGGTDDSIIVEPRIGQRQEIPRREVADVDHPGNVHIVVGGIVVAYGGIVIATAFPDCRNGTDPAAECGSAFIPALAGLGIAAWGLAYWIGSNDAADDRSLSHLPREKPRPPAREPREPPPSGEAPAPPAVLPPLPPREPGPSPGGTAPPPTLPPPSAPPPEPPPEEPPGVTW